MGGKLVLYPGLAGLLLLLACLSLFLPGGTGRAAGGDFSLDLVAAAPESYVHQGLSEGSDVTAGSLQYDSRDVGLYVVESLEGPDYSCGDRIVFFTEVTVDAGAAGSQAIDIDYRFDAEPTGQPAVGYSDIVTVGISGPAPVGAFDGQQAQEAGNQNLDGNESAVLLSESLDPPGSTVGVDAQSVLATVRVSGLDAGDVAIVRVDVRFGCFPLASDPTGTLHGRIDAAETTLGDQVNVGQQDIPMLGLGQIDTPSPTATVTTATPTPTVPPATSTTTAQTPTSTPATTATPGNPSSTSTPTPRTPPSTPVPLTPTAATPDDPTGSLPPGGPPAGPQEPPAPPPDRPREGPPPTSRPLLPSAGGGAQNSRSVGSVAIALSIAGGAIGWLGAASGRAGRRRA